MLTRAAVAHILRRTHLARYIQLEDVLFTGLVVDRTVFRLTDTPALCPYVSRERPRARIFASRRVASRLQTWNTCVNGTMLAASNCGVQRAHIAQKVRARALLLRINCTEAAAVAAFCSTRSFCPTRARERATRTRRAPAARRRR